MAKYRLKYGGEVVWICNIKEIEEAEKESGLKRYIELMEERNHLKV